MAAQSKPIVLFVVSVLLVMMGGAGYFVLMSSPDPQVVERVVEVPAPPVERGTEPPAPARPERPLPAPERDPGAAAVDEPVVPSRNRMARDLERERIWSALGREHSLEPAAPGSAAPSEAAAAHLPQLDKQYIQSAISEQLLPIAKECYSSALEDEPELAGKVVTRFVIIGAEEVGGIVETAEISAESTLDSPFVRECMRESLMTVTFEPPEDGGRIEVSYPFIFKPG